MSRINENQSSLKRFITELSFSANGEVAEKKALLLDADKISNESRFDELYAVCTTLDKNISDIIHINKMRWQVEAAFRTMKNEFKARPVYLRNDDRITAHFLTCFLSLLTLRIIAKKTDGKFTDEELLKTLRTMNVYHLRNLGYLSAYTRTPVTDALHEAFDFRTDMEFISSKTMKKILSNIGKA